MPGTGVCVRFRLDPTGKAAALEMPHRLAPYRRTATQEATTRDPTTRDVAGPG